MNKITSYTDYRKLLRDFYELKKSINPQFSFTCFSKIAGITSRGYLYNVVAGKRKLSSSHIAGIATAMGFSKSENEYFEYLIAFNNARTIVEKKKHFERMNSVKELKNNSSQPHLLRKEQYIFYSQWYNAVVRSLIGLKGFSGDYEKLAQMVNPPITVTQTKKSVALLEKLGFIKKNEDLSYSLIDNSIATPPEVISLAIHDYHLQSAEIAKKVLNTLPRERRNFTAVTLGISDSAFTQVCKELENFRNRLMDIAENDKVDGKKQSVYQLNLQLFSVSVK